MSVDHWFRPALRRQLIAGHEPEWLKKHKRRQYVRQAVLSCPLWVTKEQLKAVVRERNRMTKLTGVEHVVDHIIPLNHPRICGLTVPENLQVVPRKTNAHKGGGWCEWQGDLFDGPNSTS